MNSQKTKLVQQFIHDFEQVFHEDWKYTKEMLCIHEETEEQKREAKELGLETIHMISPEGTFLEPRIEDETEDWGYRGKLLSTYRELKKLGF